MGVMLTPQDLESLREVVETHMRALAISIVGPEAVGATQADLDRLVASGVLDPAVLGTIDPIRDAHVIGYLSRAMENDGIDPLTLEPAKFTEYLTVNEGMLTPAEQAAVAQARVWAGQDITGLGDRVTAEIVGMTREEYRAAVRDAVGAGLEARDTARAVATRIGNATGDWTRDLMRVASTEMQDAQNEGYGMQVAADLGPRAGMAMIPNPDACPHCRRLYLSGGKPKVFSLSELVGNGTNRGRKARDWLPTLKPPHPRCHCRPVHVPPGFTFDDEWNLVRG